jgi:hypothetical protein
VNASGMSQMAMEYDLHARLDKFWASMRVALRINAVVVYEGHERLWAVG